MARLARSSTLKGGPARGPGDGVGPDVADATRDEAACASSMLFSLDDLDPAIDPRADFDGYVNARWRARTPVPADRGCWGSFTIAAETTLLALRAIAGEAAAMPPDALRRHIDASVAGRPIDDTSGAQRIVGALWRTGMDLDARERSGLDALADDLAAIDAVGTREGLAVLIDAAHARGESLLWSIEVVPDVADPALLQLRIGPACGPLGRVDHLGSARPAVRRRRLCAAYFAGLLRRSGCAPDAARHQAKRALALERALVAAMPEDAMRDVAARHRSLALAQARREVRPLSFDACLAATGAALPAKVSLPAPDFHAAVARLLAERPVAHWKAWLRVRLLDAAAPDMGESLRAFHHRFHGRALRGLRVEPPPWKRVLAAIDRVVPDAMAQLYVLRQGAADTRTEVQALFESLRAALRARIAGADWLSGDARARAIAKVEAMRALLVAPETWPDWRGLPTASPSFHGVLRAARVHEFRRRLRRLAMPPGDRPVADEAHADDWSMPAYRVNARYDPQRNCIEVPAGILQPPFFHPGAGRASHYGAIGAVMAHEMSHGFDDQGRRFDAAGRLGDGWPAADVAAFDRRADAVAAWFDRMPDGIGGRVDGRRTLGENLADITGLAVAWDAYAAEAIVACEGQAGPDAAALRFFIAWGVMWRQVLTPAEAVRRAALDHHAPAALRANVAASALPAFWGALGGRGGHGAAGVPGVW